MLNNYPKYYICINFPSAQKNCQNTLFYAFAMVLPLKAEWNTFGMSLLLRPERHWSSLSLALDSVPRVFHLALRLTPKVSSFHRE